MRWGGRVRYALMSVPSYVYFSTGCTHSCSRRSRGSLDHQDFPRAESDSSSPGRAQYKLCKCTQKQKHIASPQSSAPNRQILVTWSSPYAGNIIFCGDCFRQLARDKEYENQQVSTMLKKVVCDSLAEFSGQLGQPWAEVD